MLRSLFAMSLAAALTLMPFSTRAATDGPSPLQFKAKDIDGKEVELNQYKGKVTLIVNVASKCGNTPQYEGLEALYKKYNEKGFTILGFPANEFKAQEPGTDADIKQFCTSKYGVTFPMFSKVVVKGDGQSELYKFLTSKESNPQFAGDITWNFEKFLTDKNGKIIARFSPKTVPNDPEITKAIETALVR